MADILQMTYSKAFSWMKSLQFPLKFYKFIPQSPIKSKPELVQIMAWHWKYGKPLSEPVIA